MAKPLLAEDGESTLHIRARDSLGTMLGYEVRQLRLEGTGRFYLPLPKLSASQLRFLADNLRARSFSVKDGGSKLAAVGGSEPITIVRSGLAWSGGDLLDALAPAIPDLLRGPREISPSNPYFVVKSARGTTEIQFFPRMEGLTLWSVLRMEGKCGVTPDEKEALAWILRDSEQEVQCVTDYPTDGSGTFQVGRKQYYHSKLPSREFASRLRTITTSSRKNSYLSRNSVVSLKQWKMRELPSGDEFGEWCYLDFAPKSL